MRTHSDAGRPKFITWSKTAAGAAPARAGRPSKTVAHTAMTIAFNAEEILAMAARIERNGKIFYKTAAGRAGKFKDLFLRLAKEEAGHLAIFEAMRKKLSAEEREETAYDPGRQNGFYLQAMADRAVFKPGAPASIKKQQETGLAGVIAAAIENEKDSIVFYVGLRELVPARLGREKINAVIDEEFKHIVFLRGITL